MTTFSSSKLQMILPHSKTLKHVMVIPKILIHFLSILVEKRMFVHYTFVTISTLEFEHTFLICFHLFLLLFFSIFHYQVWSLRGISPQR